MAHDWRAFVRKGMYSGPERDEARREFREAIETNFIPHEVQPISRLVRADNGIVAIDLGCNKGLWSKALINFYRGRLERIYMVDASIENIDECNNLEDNLVFDPDDQEKLVASHYAVGDRDGTVKFHTNVGGSPVGSIFQHTVAGEHPFETIELPPLVGDVVDVPLISIDSYVEKFSIEKIDILKLDIEGNEWDALRGAKAVLEKMDIDAIQFEFGAGQVEARSFFKDFYEFFKVRGYKIYRISGEHFATHGDYLMPIERYGYQLERFDGAWNFVASKNVPQPLAQDANLDSGLLETAHAQQDNTAIEIGNNDMLEEYLNNANNIPGQLTDLEARTIVDLASRVPNGGRIVETGSLYGRSSYLWAKGAGPNTEVFCFDPWHRAQWIIDYVEGPLGAPEFGIEAFKEFTKDCSNIKPIPGYSPQSAEGWDKPIDLFFEDAVHEDPIFSQNCDFWLSHLKPGGIFCGHDFRADYHDITKRVIQQALDWNVPFHVAGSFFWMQKPVS